MKYKTITLLFLFLFIFSLDKIYAKTTRTLSLIGRTIIIDPGHGGKDPGTSHKDVLEKDINLKISLELETELIKRGADVILIRDGDYDLSYPNATFRKKSDFDNRIRLINDSKANLYISIHLNYLVQSAKYSGAQVFYNEKKESNKIIADITQASMNKELKNDRMAKKIPVDTYMYEKLEPSGILIECGFLSNANERELLQTEEYQKKIAFVIANAIEKAI